MHTQSDTHHNLLILDAKDGEECLLVSDLASKAFVGLFDAVFLDADARRYIGLGRFTLREEARHAGGDDGKELAKNAGTDEAETRRIMDS